MRSEGPSLTALGVAIARSVLTRPSTPTGDPVAEARLVASLGVSPAASGPEPKGGLFDWVEARTRFFGEAMLCAIADGVGQIVILGALAKVVGRFARCALLR